MSEFLWPWPARVTHKIMHFPPEAHGEVAVKLIVEAWSHLRSCTALQPHSPTSWHTRGHASTPCLNCPCLSLLSVYHAQARWLMPAMSDAEPCA